VVDEYGTISTSAVLYTSSAPYLLYLHIVLTDRLVLTDYFAFVSCSSSIDITAFIPRFQF